MTNQTNLINQTAITSNCCGVAFEKREGKEYCSYCGKLNLAFQTNQTIGNTTTQQAKKLLFEVSSHKKKDKEVVDKRTIKATSRKQAVFLFKNIVDVMNEWSIDNISLKRRSKE